MKLGQAVSWLLGTLQRSLFPQNERSVAERFNGRLKQELGGSNMMARGAQKVQLDLMCGVIAIFNDQLMKLAG